MSEKLPGDLTSEQEFSLRVRADQVKTLTADELGAIIVELSRQQMIKDNLFRHLFRGAGKL